MDKYAPYVWASYGIAVSLLGFIAVFIVMRLKQSKSRYERLKSEDAE